MSKRYYFTLPDKIAEGLELWANLEGNKAASLAGFIVEQAVRQKIESGHLPMKSTFSNAELPKYEKLKQLLLENYDKLSENPYLHKRLSRLLEGQKPTTEDKLRIAIIMGLTEDYLDSLIEFSFIGEE